MKRNLFDIQSEYLEYLEELEEYLLENDTDEIPEHIQERLEINKNELEDKLSNYRLWLKQLEGEEEILKAEEEILKAKRKTKEKTVARIKGIMAEAVKMYGEVNLKSKSKATNTPKSVVTDSNKFTFIYQDKLEIDEGVLPVELFEYKIKTDKLDNSTDITICELLSKAGITFTKECTPDKDAIKQSIEEGLIPKGVKVNNDSGYIKIT